MAINRTNQSALTFEGDRNLESLRVDLSSVAEQNKKILDMLNKDAEKDTDSKLIDLSDSVSEIADQNKKTQQKLDATAKEKQKSRGDFGYVAKPSDKKMEEKLGLGLLKAKKKEEELEKAKNKSVVGTLINNIHRSATEPKFLFGLINNAFSKLFNTLPGKIIKFIFSPAGFILSYFLFKLIEAKIWKPYIAPHIESMKKFWYGTVVPTWSNIKKNVIDPITNFFDKNLPTFAELRTAITDLFDPKGNRFVAILNLIDTLFSPITNSLKRFVISSYQVIAKIPGMDEKMDDAIMATIDSMKGEQKNITLKEYMESPLGKSMLKNKPDFQNKINDLIRAGENLSEDQKTFSKVFENEIKSSIDLMNAKKDSDITETISKKLKNKGVIFTEDIGKFNPYKDGKPSSMEILKRDYKYRQQTPEDILHRLSSTGLSNISKKIHEYNLSTEDDVKALINQIKTDESSSILLRDQKATRTVVDLLLEKMDQAKIDAEYVRIGLEKLVIKADLNQKAIIQQVISPAPEGPVWASNGFYSNVRSGTVNAP